MGVFLKIDLRLVTIN